MFTAQRVKGSGIGLVYELDCECAVCRNMAGAWRGLLCEHILGFIRTQPSHARYILVGYNDAEASEEIEAAKRRAIRRLA